MREVPPSRGGGCLRRAEPSRSCPLSPRRSCLADRTAVTIGPSSTDLDKELTAMAYSVPPLPYAYDALEPYIDKATMEFHHDKHHQAYVTAVNAALEGTALADTPIEDILRDLSQV